MAGLLDFIGGAGGYVADASKKYIDQDIQRQRDQLLNQYKKEASNTDYARQVTLEQMNQSNRLGLEDQRFKNQTELEKYRTENDLMLEKYRQGSMDARSGLEFKRKQLIENFMTDELKKRSQNQIDVKFDAYEEAKRRGIDTGLLGEKDISNGIDKEYRQAVIKVQSSSMLPKEKEEALQKVNELYGKSESAPSADYSNILESLVQKHGVKQPQPQPQQAKPEVPRPNVDDQRTFMQGKSLRDEVIDRVKNKFFK